jgi:ABC-2 type transport system ATP-binding protein
MDTNAVRVRNLRKSYGDRHVVDDVSFDIARGETFALLGPNGAGKSTTVEILEGYRRRSSGEVAVLGVDVDEVIAAVGLEAQVNTRISKLSGGQQRRVDVALGIIGRPELLFLDEPTTGFDPHARREFWELIRGLKDDGVTILLTTHYLDEAAQLADRVAVIAAGRLRAIGPVATFGGERATTPIVRWSETGVVHEERAAEPWAFVTALAARLGTEPDGLEIRRPSLEDIYLELVEEPPASPAPAAAPTEGARR